MTELLKQADELEEMILELESLNYEIGQEDALKIPVDHKVRRREAQRKVITKAIIALTAKVREQERGLSKVQEELSREITIDTVQGVEGKSIYLNNHRILGSKPRGGSVISSKKIAVRDVMRAFPAMLRALDLNQFGDLTKPIQAKEKSND